MVAVLASSVSVPTLPVSLPVGEKRGVHTSDYAVRINVARVKDGPLTLTVQESGLEPRGPVPWTQLQSSSGEEFWKLWKNRGRISALWLGIAHITSEGSVQVFFSSTISQYLNCMQCLTQ